MNRCIPFWGCPSTLLSDNGLQFCAQLATVVYKLLGVHKLTISAYHPSGSGGVERGNGQVWVYNTAATIRKGLRKGADDKVLNEKLSLIWTGPFKTIAVGPSPRLTNPTDARSETSCYILTSPQTCPALLLNLAVERLTPHPPPPLSHHDDATSADKDYYVYAQDSYIYAMDCYIYGEDYYVYAKDSFIYDKDYV